MKLWIVVWCPGEHPDNVAIVAARYRVDAEAEGRRLLHISDDAPGLYVEEVSAGWVWSA